jgi:hypothetical protein
MRRAWLVEAGAVCGLGLAAALLAAASTVGPWPWMGWASLAALAAGGLLLAGSAVAALWRRRWTGGALRLAALIVFLPVMLVACVVAGFAGKALRMGASGMDLRGSPELPVEADAMNRLVAAGNDFARRLDGAPAADGTGFALDSVGCSFGPEGRKVSFDFVRGPASAFRGSVSFKRRADGTWSRDGYSASGDPASFEGNRTAFNDSVESLGVLPDFAWPVAPQVEQDWTKAADRLAAAASACGVLGTDGTPWRTDSIRLTRNLRPGNRDAIAIWLKAARGRERVAYAVTDWAFDGRQARLLDVQAGVDGDRRSDSTLEHGAEVRSVLESALVAGDDLLAPSALVTSRHDGTWESCEARLPDGTILTYRQQLAHAFLAEYHMILSIRPPGGPERDFVLPMNTGGRTAILVGTGTLGDGAPAVRLDAGRHFDLAFTLRDPRIVPVESLRDERPAGAITGVSTRLRWVAGDTPEDRSLIEQARAYQR